MDIDLPEPAPDTPLRVLVDLSRVAEKVYYNIYSHRPGSVAAFCKKVQEIQGELTPFQSVQMRFLFTDEELDSMQTPTAIQIIMAFSRSILWTFHPAS